MHFGSGGHEDGCVLSSPGKGFAAAINDHRESSALPSCSALHWFSEAAASASLAWMRVLSEHFPIEGTIAVH